MEPTDEGNHATNPPSEDEIHHHCKRQSKCIAISPWGVLSQERFSYPVQLPRARPSEVCNSWLPLTCTLAVRGSFWFYEIKSVGESSLVNKNYRCGRKGSYLLLSILVTAPIETPMEPFFIFCFFLFFLNRSIERFFFCLFFHIPNEIFFKNRRKSLWSEFFTKSIGTISFERAKKKALKTWKKWKNGYLDRCSNHTRMRCLSQHLQNANGFMRMDHGKSNLPHHSTVRTSGSIRLKIQMELSFLMGKEQMDSATGAKQCRSGWFAAMKENWIQSLLLWNDYMTEDLLT